MDLTAREELANVRDYNLLRPLYAAVAFGATALMSDVTIPSSSQAVPISLSHLVQVCDRILR